MDERLRIKQPIDDCPFCKSDGKMFRRRLWHGELGYIGKYSYYISCDNPECPVKPSTKHRNDIYESSEETINKVVLDWNWEYEEIETWKE